MIQAMNSPASRTHRCTRCRRSESCSRIQRSTARRKGIESDTMNDKTIAGPATEPRGPCQNENTGANDRADAQRREVECAECASEGMPLGSPAASACRTAMLSSSISPLEKLRKAWVV